MLHIQIIAELHTNDSDQIQMAQTKKLPQMQIFQK